MGELKLEDMSVARLQAIIEEDYYRACIQGRLLHEGADEKKLKALIDEVGTTELNCAKLERYDLAALCRDKAEELTLNLDLNISV